MKNPKTWLFLLVVVFALLLPTSAIAAGPVTRTTLELHETKGCMTLDVYWTFTETDIVSRKITRHSVRSRGESTLTNTCTGVVDEYTWNHNFWYIVKDGVQTVHVSTSNGGRRLSTGEVFRYHQNVVSNGDRILISNFRWIIDG